MTHKERSSPFSLDLPPTHHKQHNNLRSLLSPSSKLSLQDVAHLLVVWCRLGRTIVVLSLALCLSLAHPAVVVPFLFLPAVVVPAFPHQSRRHFFDAVLLRFVLVGSVFQILRRWQVRGGVGSRLVVVSGGFVGGGVSGGGFRCSLWWCDAVLRWFAAFLLRLSLPPASPRFVRQLGFWWVLCYLVCFVCVCFVVFMF